MTENFLTLTEVSETIEGNYPIVVRVLPKDYEIPEPTDLPGDLEILLEKPKCLQFAHVRIAALYDERQKRKEKGDEFVKERNEYVGKEYLIPLCYPGKLKLLNKPGQLGRYTSMTLVKQDLPRYIRMDQETVYTPPDKSHSTSSLDAGTILEIKGVQTVENIDYVKCKSVKTSREYIFSDDLSVKCSAVDDPKEHTMLSLAAEAVVLPKVVQFRNIWADDIVMKNDNEASTLLTLTGGPIKILRTFVKRNVFIAWLKTEGTPCKTVALIPKKGWDNQLVQITPFDDETEKEEYIKTQFGVGLDSSFVLSTLYIMKPNEANVIWLRGSQLSERDDEELVDYENVEKKLGDYDNSIQRAEEIGGEYQSTGSQSEEETEEEVEDYEKPISQASPVPHCIPHEEVLLPIHKPRLNSHVLRRIKEKAMIGFDKVHDQLLKRAKTIHKNHTGLKHKKHRMTQPPMKSKQELKQHTYRKTFDTSESFSQDEDTAEEGDHRLQRFTIVSERNRDRPLPDLPTKASVNVTDDYKVYLYDRAEDKEEAFLRKLTENESKMHAHAATLPRFLDWSRVGRPGQTSDDFYSYSVEELEECFNMCGLKKLADVCSPNQLDGAFFRNFDLDELKSDPFCLGKIEVIKVKKIIEYGWRPKTQKESATF